jgi:hypothetical protein
MIPTIKRYGIHKGIEINGRIKPHFLIAKEGMK